MGILRKLRKLGDLLSDREENNPQPPPPAPPIPNHRPWLRNEIPPHVNHNYGPLPQSFFNAVDSARQQAGYDPLPVFPRETIPDGEGNHLYEEPVNDFPPVDRSRSKSRERQFDRIPRSQSRGTPVKFRRRPPSPELLQASHSSPFLFRQHSLPNSPDMHRRFQHPQQFQHIPRQTPQVDMMMAYPNQFYPQFQQQFYPVMNPNVNMQPWFMMRQPQMYPFF